MSVDLQLAYRKNLIRLLKCRNNKIVIYPFGKTGVLLKQLLETTFDIKDCLRIDRELSLVNKNILKVEDLNDKADKNEYIYLVTMDKGEFFDNLVNQGIYEKNIIFMSGDYKEFFGSVLLWYVNKYKAKSLYDYDRYFFNRNAISKCILHYSSKEYVDISDVTVYAEKKQDDFPIYDVIYEQYKEKQYTDLMFLELTIDIVETGMEKIINKYKDLNNQILFINKDYIKFDYKKYNLKREVYGYFELFIYENK